MSKYTPLGQFLARQDKDSVRVSFRQIEDVLGFKLPASKLSRAWWSNNPTNSVMTKVWLDAGWRTRKVDLEKGTLTFFRASARPRDGVNWGKAAFTSSATLDLVGLDPVARQVLDVLARRSGRSPVDEAIQVLNEALAP